MRPVGVEICVDDVAGALAAEAQGADRVELCANLGEGGVTPSIGLVRCVLARVRRLGVQVMIRPRGGDFVHDATELAVMRADIAAIRALPVPAGVRLGFVFGVLTPGGAVDAPVLASLKAACGAAPTTFHRAFDAATDPAAALEALVAGRIDRVLTGGGPGTAAGGAAGLAALVRQAAGRIAVLAGGGVRAPNVAALLAATGVPEVHLRAMEDVPGRPPRTVPAEIAAVVRAVRGAA